MRKKQFNIFSHTFFVQIKTQNKNEVKNTIIRIQHGKTHKKGYLVLSENVFHMPTDTLNLR